MKNVLVFFDKDKATLVKVEDHLDTITRANAAGVFKTLPVSIRFATLTENKSGACWIAADRLVSSSELIQAHKTLLSTETVRIDNWLNH